MRIVPAVQVSAKPRPVYTRSGTTSPTAIICVALMLALVFLAFQVASSLRMPSFSDCSSIGDSVEATCPSSF